jgi:shikimate dehydrogenase
MIEKTFSHHSMDWRYLTLEIAPEQLADAVRGMRAMGFRGGNVAEPHRQTIMGLLDRVSETAALLGAVNLLLREEETLVGHNTDGKGLIESLQRVTDPVGKRVVLLGAGRMARAVAVALAAAGVAEIRIVNRTEPHAAELAALLAGKFAISASAATWQGNYQVPPDIDVLVNATSIGPGDSHVHLPLAMESLRPQLIVADLTTSPPKTRLLREAGERGCRTLDGLGMFIDQAAYGFRAWTGVEPDRNVMREAVEEFLEL